MDIINGSSRIRHRKTPSSDRFLGIHPHTQAHNAAAEEDELNEDDIFSTGDFSADSLNHHHNNHYSSPSSSAASTPRNLHIHHHKPAFLQPDSFGILAALPEHRGNPHHQHYNHLYQKTTLSSSSSSAASSASASSARLIPSIPKPPQERLPIAGSLSKYSHHQQHQSAPVNVPTFSMGMRMRRSDREFDEIDEDEEEGDGEMLPPHEMVARAQSPLVACSVLEGVGRTLKGRDLRQVRNAVFRRTGFLD